MSDIAGSPVSVLIPTYNCGEYICARKRYRRAWASK